MRNTVFGILAHVDAGKTTLSEQLLLQGGAIRQAGRVDKGTSFLDSNSIERERGITVYSKQAVLTLSGRPFTLLDTPGHSDFSGEAERVLSVLDAAILIVSASTGVNGHTVLLKKLIDRYHIPTILFVNKTDIAGYDRAALLAEIQEKLGAQCIPAEAIADGSAAEDVAVLDESLLESYLETETLPDGAVRDLYNRGLLVPVNFGSALKGEGIEGVIEGLLATDPEKGRVIGQNAGIGSETGTADEAGKHIKGGRGNDTNPFSARVFGITNADKRLTFLKVTGGVLHVRDEIVTGRTGQAAEADGTQGSGNPVREKVTELRVYSGEKYTGVQEAFPGDVVAVCGLTQTYAGQGLGAEADALQPAVAPVMKARVIPGDDVEDSAFRTAVAALAEEEPGLSVETAADGAVYFRLMGALQEEILQKTFADRFGIAISFGPERVVYAETIRGKVEGAGHYEPLRHYAEVHLLLEEGAPGSGIVIESACPTDVLDRTYQRQVIDSLYGAAAAGDLRGVLTGAPLTDVRITLISGKSHVKHTEPGDFREAALRALRQGLMRAENVLLEPVLSFEIRLPQGSVGRALTDISAMGGEADAPVLSPDGSAAVIGGMAPAAAISGYAADLRSYTAGEGTIELEPAGYRPAAKAAELIELANYDPDRDTEHPTGSVFCTHEGGGFIPWDEVADNVHLPYTYKHTHTYDANAWVRATKDARSRAGAAKNTLHAAGEASESDKEESRTGGSGTDAARAKAQSGAGLVVAGPGAGWLLASVLESTEPEDTGSGFVSGGGPERGEGRDLTAIMNSLGKSANQKAKPRGRDRDIEKVRKREEELRKLRKQEARELKKNEERIGKIYGTAGANGNGTAGRQGAVAGAGGRSAAAAGVPAKADLLLVDGYNIIFAWENLRELANRSIDAARGALNDVLSNYAGFTGAEVIVVYDAYLLENHAAEILTFHNIHVVFTATAETADQYIEQTAIRRAKDAVVTVATSDRVERVIVASADARVMTAETFRGQVDAVNEEIRGKI